MAAKRTKLLLRVDDADDDSVLRMQFSGCMWTFSVLCDEKE